jgi:uncharacterized membrane protein
MTMVLLRTVAIGMMVAVATPVLAQMPPPQDAPQGGRMMKPGMFKGDRAFPSMSEGGRKTMMEAMQAGGDRRQGRDAVKAARDRMLTLLEADKLDNGALKRAMDEERNTANASRERHQAAMLGAFTKLSVADRKAFVTDSRAMKSRMEQRMQDWRGKRGGRGDMMPPPPPAGM